MALQVGGDKEGRGRGQEADYCAAVCGVGVRAGGRKKMVLKMRMSAMGSPANTAAARQAGTLRVSGGRGPKS